MPKVVSNDPRWKVGAEEDLAELLDQFEGNLDLRELAGLASKIEDAVEDMPGHGGQAGYYARDLPQMISNLKKVLGELKKFAE